MDTSRRLALATDQLNRTLGFFSRLDAKHSVVLAIDTAMLAFLVARAPAISTIVGWYAVAPIAAIVLLALSIGMLYAGGSPNLTGGHESLVYFREIAKRTETGYVDAFRGISEEAYLKDVLGQVWRNSEILSEKFAYLKKALWCLAAAIVPWLIALFTFVLRTPNH